MNGFKPDTVLWMVVEDGNLDHSVDFEMGAAGNIHTSLKDAEAAARDIATGEDALSCYIYELRPVRTVLRKQRKPSAARQAGRSSDPAGA